MELQAETYLLHGMLQMVLEQQKLVVTVIELMRSEFEHRDTQI